MLTVCCLRFLWLKLLKGGLPVADKHEVNPFLQKVVDAFVLIEGHLLDALSWLHVADRPSPSQLQASLEALTKAQRFQLSWGLEWAQSGLRELSQATRAFLSSVFPPSCS